MHSTAELFEAARLGDEEAMGRLIEENSGLIWSIARRYFGRGVEADDLYQLGCVGFIKAVRGFDSQFGTQFSTYAVPKIAGEIRRFLRDDGSVKLSRTIKERGVTISRARSALEQKLGREPTVSEISEITGITVEEIASCEIALTPSESLERERGEDGMSLEDVLGSKDSELNMIEKISLSEAISSLPEKYRQVILLRYFRDLTQSDTAKLLDISQVQVSRIEKKAIGELKEALK
ncbi:MAG: sigma-70 family RNA polymerase sigma factor [Oscillospiraceae bacterium]|nr:sigma-70 family RNA polymerase sigma factor [Oscillospiraceae bacterium]